MGQLENIILRPLLLELYLVKDLSGCFISTTSFKKQLLPSFTQWLLRHKLTESWLR